MDERSSLEATKRDGLSLVDILDKEEEVLLAQVDRSSTIATTAMHTDRTDCEDDESDALDAINGRMNTPANMDVPEGYCVECRDQAAYIYCELCHEDFCEVCFAMLHRTGNRKKHPTRLLHAADGAQNESAALDQLLNGSNNNSNPNAFTTEPTLSEQQQQQALSSSSSSVQQQNNTSINDLDSSHLIGGKIVSSDGGTFGEWLLERTKYIPLRLSLEERKLLRLLEAALNVSEYTDKIDILYYGNKVKRMVHQIKDICAIISGLLVASDYRAGQILFAERTFQENAQFFSRMFEIGRRYKIMNPEKMRSAYGKLMYMLQDSAIPEVQDTLEFSCRDEIKTVYRFLEERKALALIADDYIITATKEIIPEGKTRVAIQREIKQKEYAVAMLSRKYASSLITPEEIQNCLHSIGDNHSYLRSNRDPCDKMLHYLTANFRPESAESNEYSLAILCGRSGARLTHSHEQQYRYVHQTLSLWREILHDMFMLWWMADQDLLSERVGYRLKDTGQGLNRVQACPLVSKAVHRILHRAQQRAGHWIGSSVVHLGDKNVPNALMFIDKYNQVSRILGPLVTCLGQLDRLSEHAGLEKYVKAYYGDAHQCRKQILTDFFRFAFDGSGADNFFDAGSCIDGRLTSAWNWCSLIEKKEYYPVFLLTGFTGFDGEQFQ